MAKKRILNVDDEASYTRLLKWSLVQTDRYEVDEMHRRRLGQASVEGVGQACPVSGMARVF